MEQAELTKEQKQSREETLVRASAFALLAHNEGFKYIKAYYENKLQSFVTSMFTQENKAIGEFEAERREIMGLKKMFGEIDWALTELEREKNAKPTE